MHQAAADEHPRRYTKNVVYKSYHEVSVALADHGISLDSIQKLKQIEFKPPEREDEEVN